MIKNYWRFSIYNAPFVFFQYIVQMSTSLAITVNTISYNSKINDDKLFNYIFWYPVHQSKKVVASRLAKKKSDKFRIIRYNKLEDMKH